MADPATTPGTADPYADHAAILQLVKSKRDEWGKGRQFLLQAPYRNLLFYRGRQWIRWDRAAGRYRPAAVPRDVPTPVVNRFACTLDAVTSVFGRIEPMLNFRPGNPDEPGDRATADVARRVIEVIEDEVSIRQNRQILAPWVAFTGGAWIETGYDPDPVHGTREIPIASCGACGYTAPPSPDPACPTCGAPLALGMETVPVGKMYVDVVPLFEAFFDPTITDWKKHRAFLREKSTSLDEAKARWTALGDSIVANSVGATGDDWYMGSLSTLGPELEDRGSARWGQTAGLQQTNRVTEQWYSQLPDATYPEGLLAIVVSRSQVAYAAPLPYTTLTEGGARLGFLNYTWFPQKLVPGTFWPKTVADDLAPVQADRNRWQSIIQLCGMRMGSPVWLEPLGANVKQHDRHAGPGDQVQPHRARQCEAGAHSGAGDSPRVRPDARAVRQRFR